jgi:hypothetical protein
MPRKLTLNSRINRTAFQVTSLKETASDVTFWRSQTPQARLRTMELLRQINYGQAAISARLERVLEIAQLEKS